MVWNLTNNLLKGIFFKILISEGDLEFPFRFSPKYKVSLVKKIKQDFLLVFPFCSNIYSQLALSSPNSEILYCLPK